MRSLRRSPLRQHEGGIRDLRAWTWTVAFRVATAEMRRRPTPVDEPIAGEDERFETRPDLVRALKRLPARQRLALVLHDYADRPTSEVASVLGCTRATVHVHLSKGRKRLRELLEVRDA
jgi:RNA polymerase sigma-70 factor (ECF subfamily)